MEPRPDSLFLLSELWGDTWEGPQTYTSTETIMPIYETEYTGSVRIKVWGRERWFNLTDKDLKNLRHEIVATVAGPSTDEKLSTIGVTGKEAVLTPDFILRDSKVVIELGTCAGNDDSALRSMYNDKMVKYSKLITSRGYDYAPIIVGRSKVLTCIKLTQAAVNALCLRFRVGYAMEAKLIDLIGENIFQEDWSKLEDQCREVISQLEDSSKSSDKFDKDIINSMRDEPSKVESARLGSILRHNLHLSSQKSKETDIDLMKYISEFDLESKRDFKRITNIPMVICNFQHQNEFLDPEHSNMPDWMRTVWCEGRNVGYEAADLRKSIEEAMNKVEYSKHRLQKESAFNVILSESDRIEAAKSGLWAKTLKDMPEIIEKDRRSHLSFHPTETPTDDIERFINFDMLESYSDSTAVPTHIWKLIQKAKDVTGPDSISSKVLQAITKSKLSWFGQMISELFTEICYTYKYWIKRSDFYHKVHKGVHMLIRCTGDHTFVSFAFPKKGTEVIDTGRIGPVIWESSNFYFTKFSSFNEPTVEHFVKAGPYLTSIYCHLLSHFEQSLSCISQYDDNMIQTLNGILLLYLNNKTDAEELITNQRYLTMGVLEEIDPNPFRFVDRLPDVYRSRLTCFLLKRTIFHMNHYNSSKVVKSRSGLQEDESLEYDGVLSIFTNRPITLKQKINEFYFGYVISKERGRGSDRNFKIMKKIVAEEYRFRDTVKKTFEDSIKPGIHVSNPIVIKVFMSIFRGHLKKLYGRDWEFVLSKAIIHNMAMKSFYEIATMKVASRTYFEKIMVPTLPQEATTSEIRQALEYSNPNEKKRRPRVMEALKWLVDDYVAEGNAEPTHPIDLLPYCLRRLQKKGFFDSDIFPKPQHGGDREIHVLEITMRIVQLFTESISRTMCEHIDSDSLTHPKSKDTFVRNHYKTANETLAGGFVTLGKSADATKWCQRHHSSKFAAVLVGCVPKVFHNLILSVMFLWMFKRITFPIQFAANFMSNQNVKSNPIYERMRSDFFSGTNVFREPQNNKMWIQSGMMQGILHYTSSLVHAVVQVVMMIIQQSYLANKNIKSHVTIIQGSDDSAEMLSLSGRKPAELVQIGTTMLHWKENMGRYFSIYTSRAKSSIGTLDLIEYNSEWSIRSSIIKPTFRWVSSCLETGIVEKFVDRYQNMQGTLTTVLEGGGKLLEAAMIQMCQAWMHYMLLGLHTSVLAELATYFMMGVKDPSLGFFPLDSDFTAGITGFNYSLHQLYVKTNYGDGLGRTSMKDVEIDFFEDDTKDPTIGKDLRKVRIKFGDHKIFNNILRDMSIPEITQILEEVEKDPSMLYFPSHDWSTSKFRIFLKVFEPGVKESLSRHSATARMMSASAYMLSRPCMSHMESGEKRSLLYLLAEEFHRPSRGKLDPHLVFLHHNEYKDLEKFIDELGANPVLREQNIKTRSKQKIAVFTVDENSIPLVDLCRRKWFERGRLPLSETQFEIRWAETKRKYPFLDDKREQTKLNLKMSDVQLKNFLEAQTEKSRYITLMDTPAKSSSINNCITRVFWANTKIVQSRSEDDSDSSHGLRSKIFSILTSWLTYKEMRKEITYLLVNSDLLAENKVPARVAKLKCIRDLIVSGHKYNIVDRILQEKLGSIGFFTVRQSGYGENRKGYGEWKGRVLGTSVKIDMFNNECIAIHVNNVHRTKELGYMLAQLINGFSLKTPKEFLKAEHWLSLTGKISYGIGSKKSIPIIVSTDLKVDILDQVTNYDWDWDINFNRLRILARANTSLKETITLVSESFTSSDWDPFHGFEGSSDLAAWSRGDRINIDQLRNEFSGYLGKTKSGLVKCINRLSKETTANGWSVQRTVEILKSMFPKTRNSKPSDEESEISMDQAEIDDIMKFVMLNEEDDIGIANELIDQDQEEEIGMTDLFELRESDLRDLEIQLELLTQQADPSMNSSVDRSKMPLSNQFFNNLNTLSLTSFGISFSELWTRFSENSSLLTHDILGVILSFMTGRVCLKMLSDDEEEVEGMERESISLITSIKSDMEVEDLNEEELNWAISDLEARIPTAPPRFQPKLKSTLKRYKVALRLISIPVNDKYDLDSLETQDMLYTISKEVDTISFSDTPRLAVAQIRSYIDTQLDDMLSQAEITPHEHSVYRESLYKSYCTPMLVDAISLSFGISISIKNYTSGEFSKRLDLNKFF